MSAGDGEGFRPLQQSEREILRRLLEDHPFQCREELGKQLDSATARLIDEHNDNYGRIELRVADATPANVRFRVPVEAEYRDDDDCPVWVLLHVVNGFLDELEIVRADGQPLISPLIPERLNVY